MPPRLEAGAFHEQGWWGEVTSSVNWCELDYDVTKFICEFCNTLSSAAILLVGLVGLALHFRALERRFAVAFAAVMAVGAGSIGFHTTLRHEWQMMDEVPMLWSALSMTFILVEDKAESVHGRWFPLALAAHGTVTTLLVALSGGALQFVLFHTSFGTLEFYSLYRVYLLWSKATGTESPAPVAVRRLYRQGFGCYGVGLVCWATDLLCCETIRSALPANPQLHAWWHVFVSGGLYSLLLCVAHNRCAVLGQRPSIAWLCGCLPYVALPPLEVVGKRMVLHPPTPSSSSSGSGGGGGGGGESGRGARARSPSPQRRRRSKSRDKRS
jgi:dihydroceramidase